MTTGIAAVLWGVLALGLQGGTGGSAGFDDPVGAAEPRDLRSWELLDFICSSDLGHHRMTLFGNGTVRIKTLQGEEGNMRLRELAPEELAGYVNRLREEDLTETESSARSASGEWVESCELTLELDDGQEQFFRFARFDSLSLALSRIKGIVEEITAWAEQEMVVTDFPADYQPRSGDILKRKDGVIFEVIALTSDKRGVEMRGVDQPLVIYVMLEDVVGEFVTLVERRRQW